MEASELSASSPWPVLGSCDDCLVDLDRVEFVGKRKALDSRSKPGDCLVVFERREGVRTRRFGPALVGGGRHFMADQGLGTELAEQEFSQRCPGGVEQARVGLHRLSEGPAPALAVVHGSLEALGKRVIDGRAIGRDGCAGLIASPETPTDCPRNRASHRVRLDSVAATNRAGRDRRLRPLPW